MQKQYTTYSPITNSKRIRFRAEKLPMRHMAQNLLSSRHFPEFPREKKQSIKFFYRRKSWSDGMCDGLGRGRGRARRENVAVLTERNAGKSIPGGWQARAAQWD